DPTTPGSMTAGPARTGSRKGRVGSSVAATITVLFRSTTASAVRRGSKTSDFRSGLESAPPALPTVTSTVPLPPADLKGPCGLLPEEGRLRGGREGGIRGAGRQADCLPRRQRPGGQIRFARRNFRSKPGGGVPGARGRPREQGHGHRHHSQTDRRGPQATTEV